MRQLELEVKVSLLPAASASCWRLLVWNLTQCKVRITKLFSPQVISKERLQMLYSVRIIILSLSSLQVMSWGCIITAWVLNLFYHLHQKSNHHRYGNCSIILLRILQVLRLSWSFTFSVTNFRMLNLMLRLYIKVVEMLPMSFKLISITMWQCSLFFSICCI